MQPHDRPVSEIMRTDFVFLRLHDRLDFADQVMRLGRIRHLPVLDEGRLAGIVSNRDLLAASLTKVLDFDARERRAFLHSVEVAEVMTRSVHSVAPTTRLGEAARLMLSHKIGCLPVVSGAGLVVGLVTETDLLRAAYLGHDDASLGAGAGGAAPRG